MTDDSKHNRHSIRLNGYDYSCAGAYFITVCAHHRACLFGKIMHGDMQLNHAGEMIQTVWDGLQMRFNDIEWDEFVVMPNHMHGIIVLPRRRRRRGESCIRPPIRPPVRPQGICDDTKNKGDHKDRPYDGDDSNHACHPDGDDNNRTGYPNGTSPDSLGRIVQAFKSITTHAYINGVKQSGWPPFSGKLWQRNYWDHIVRNEPELNRIRSYIRHNPSLWESDKLKTSNVGGVHEPASEYAEEAWML